MDQQEPRPHFGDTGAGSHVRPGKAWGPAGIATVYAVLGGLWIAFSDRLLAAAVTDPAALNFFQTIKGWAYVALTAALLYILIRRHVAALRQSHAIAEENASRTQAILDSAGDAIITFDATGVIESFNPSAEQIFGCPAGDVVGRPIEAILPLASAPQTASAPTRGCAGVLGRLQEVLGTRRNGDSFPMELAVDEVRGTHRVQYVAVVRDISARRQAEADRALLGTAANQAAESILIMDATGRIEYVNPAFEELTGFQRHEVIGRELAVLHHNADDLGFLDRVWHTLVEEELWRGEVSGRRADGTTYEEDALISPVRDADGRITRYLRLGRDITQERRLQNQLHQVQKLEAIGTLAGGIAHDFNNILTAILGFVELAKSRAPDATTAELDGYLDEVVTAGQRAKSLVQQILTFSRQSDSEIRPVELVPLVTETMRLVRAGIPSTIEIRTDFSVDSATVLANPTQIHQIVMNLCTNAAQAIGTRGRLEVAIREEPPPEKAALAETDRDGPAPFVCLEVRDTGCGMTDEIQARIFEPYFTTKGVGEGTGLGLSVVHGIATSLGGRVTVESQPGAGATFRVYLPRAPLRDTTRLGQEEPVAGGHERLLLVDDEPQVRALGVAALDLLGYEVATCGNGPTALERVKGAAEPFDLVVADLTMPGMTGLDLARKLRQLGIPVPVILCSGMWDAVTEDAARNAGVAALLTKPVSPDALARAVRDALDRAPQPG